MITKFKSKDLVYLENNPTDKMTVIFIRGNEIHCIDGKNKQVIYDATELIKASAYEKHENNNVNLN